MSVIGRPKTDILVVDDAIANLQLLSSMLKECGYGVRPVSSGFMALRAARMQPPDLVLLDINMPEMDGYQVCRELKTDARLSPIPVIFISALGDLQNKMEGFAAGAVDYITKPFQIEEVRARVATQLELQGLQAELARRNRDLSDRNLELDRLRGLSENLTRMIVHDLRSPVAGIQGYLELLQVNAAERLSDEDRQDIGRALKSCSRVNDLVDSLLDLTRLEEAKMPIQSRRTDLAEIAMQCLSELESLKGSRNVRVDMPSAAVQVRCDPALTRRIVVNLLHNAIRYTDQSGQVELTLEIDGRFARLSVRDDGPGIPPDLHDRVFSKFAAAEMRQRRHPHSAGLGLAFCKLAVTAQGGEIGLRSEPGQGSLFWFTLPLSDADDGSVR